MVFVEKVDGSVLLGDKAIEREGDEDCGFHVVVGGVRIDGERVGDYGIG